MRSRYNENSNDDNYDEGCEANETLNNVETNSNEIIIGEIEPTNNLIEQTIATATTTSATGNWLPLLIRKKNFFYFKNIKFM